MAFTITMTDQAVTSLTFIYNVNPLESYFSLNLIYKEHILNYIKYQTIYCQYTYLKPQVVTKPRIWKTKKYNKMKQVELKVEMGHRKSRNYGSQRHMIFILDSYLLYDSITPFKSVSFNSSFSTQAQGRRHYQTMICRFNTSCSYFLQLTMWLQKALRDVAIREAKYVHQKNM